MKNPRNRVSTQDNLMIRDYWNSPHRLRWSSGLELHDVDGRDVGVLQGSSQDLVARDGIEVENGQGFAVRVSVLNTKKLLEETPAAMRTLDQPIRASLWFTQVNLFSK